MRAFVAYSRSCRNNLSRKTIKNIFIFQNHRIFALSKNYTRVMVENDTQVGINNAMQLTPASHALYAIGQNYPEP